MKKCPSCDTEYEDLVEICLVDGVALVPVVAEETATPPPAPEPPPKRGMLLPLLALGALFLFLVVGVAAVALLSTADTSATVAQPVPVATFPPPAPPNPEPAPEPAAPTEFYFDSQPAGAAVYENGTEVCTTPCAVTHPDYAPLPRTFEVRLDGHVTETMTVNEPGTRYQLRLVPNQATAPANPRPRVPRPAPVAAPRPDPEPQPQPQPKPSPDGEMSVKTNDLKNPFE